MTYYKETHYVQNISSLINCTQPPSHNSIPLQHTQVSEKDLKLKTMEQKNWNGKEEREARYDIPSLSSRHFPSLQTRPGPMSWAPRHQLMGENSKEGEHVTLRITLKEGRLLEV